MKYAWEGKKLPEGFVQTNSDGTKYYFYRWDGKTFVPSTIEYADMVKVDYPDGRNVWGNPLKEAEKKKKNRDQDT